MRLNCLKPVSIFCRQAVVRAIKIKQMVECPQITKKLLKLFPRSRNYTPSSQKFP